MLRFRTDLPLDRDTTARFLPWIIGFMVYLAMIAATVALLVDHVTQRWQRDLSGQLTVELPGIAGEDAAQRQQRVDAALEEITDTNGVIGTRLLDEAEVKRLLQPWLGDQADQLGVTLPDLVAVSVQPDIRPNLSELAERLQKVSPGAAIDDHAQFNAGALNFLRTIEVLALSLLALVLVATAGVVAFTARAGLSIHRRIVEIVHLVGAHEFLRRAPVPGPGLPLRLHGRLPRLAAGGGDPAVRRRVRRPRRRADERRGQGLRALDDLAPRPHPARRRADRHGDGPHRRAPGAAPDGVLRAVLARADDLLPQQGERGGAKAPPR